MAAKETWYLHKLKKCFGGDMEIDDILNRFSGLPCLKLCNMLTAGELLLEWVEIFSDDVKMQYKQLPVNINEFAEEFKCAHGEDVAEVIATDGRIARFTKTPEYRKYVDIIEKKDKTIRDVYGINDAEVIKKKIFQINLYEFENHPAEENPYTLYRDNDGNLQLGYLHLYKPKNKSSDGVEIFYRLVENFRAKMENDFSKEIVVKYDFEKADLIEWRIYQSYRLEDGLIVIKFDLVPAENHLSKSLIKLKEYWQLLIEEKIGSERYRALKFANPLIEFSVMAENIEPYLYDEKFANEIKSKVYEQMPTFESMYEVLLAYDKSRVLNGEITRFQEQIEDLILLLEKVELYDSKRSLRIQKRKVIHSMVELGAVLLGNINKNSSEVWFEQEKLINEMYAQAKGMLGEEHHENLNALFFILHRRTADENDLLSEYLIHEMIYTKELQKKKIVSK